MEVNPMPWLEFCPLQGFQKDHAKPYALKFHVRHLGLVVVEDDQWSDIYRVEGSCYIRSPH
jgi:hypothetical protein